MGSTSNKTIRKALRVNDVRAWELADAWGVNEATMCRKLRHEFNDDDRKRALLLIEQIAAAHEQEATQ